MAVTDRQRRRGHGRVASIAARTVSVLAAAVLATTSTTAAPAAARPAVPAGHWTGTWSTSVVAAVPDLFGLPNWSGGFADQSVRQTVRVSRGGPVVRIRLSNVYGTGPVRLTAASIGRAGQGAAVRPESLRTLTFGGRRATLLPAGREIASDPVFLPVNALERLSVTLYFADQTGPATFHPLATATSYRAAGDHVFDRAADAFDETSQAWYHLSGIDVIGPAAHGNRGAVVAFGDSITDGAGSTPDADNRYPDELAERLVAAGRDLGVLNAGIGGNQLLGEMPGVGERATARFVRDVLDRPGVRTVIVLEGINDIGFGGLTGQFPTTAQLIEAHRALITAAHARGVRAIGATLLPFAGTVFPGYYTEEGEQIRDALNDWIRTGGEYDAVVDFDRALADPADPDRLRPEYDSGDGLHPGDAGMRAMAEAIDLNSL